MACGSKLIPTPTALISGADSKMRQRNAFGVQLQRQRQPADAAADDENLH